MALFNVSLWQRSRFVLQCFIINLFVSLAWLTDVALAPFNVSESVSGSVSIPDGAFTCLGNLAVFMTAFIRGRLDMENGARDVLVTTTGPKLNDINGGGLTTLPLQDLGDVHAVIPPKDLRDVDVVILSKYEERPHSSVTQFMKYIAHSHALESITLPFLPLSSVTGKAEKCTRCNSGRNCHCVVFRATEKIMLMLAHRLPGTLKWLSESECLLPSLCCLQNGCHGCYLGCLYVEDLYDEEAAGESSGWSKNYPREHSPAAAVCEALNEYSVEEEASSCICIPVHPWDTDRWTKFMIKFLKSKEKEEKGIEDVVLKALQNYITNSAKELGLFYRTATDCIVVREIYDSASIILPRVAEVIVNMVLTGWLRVDGLSSSLVARRAIRDRVVDSAGTGFGANAFLTQAVVFCSKGGTNVCQLLCFRGGILSPRRVSYMVGFVNLICAITWSVLIAWDGNWAHLMPPSTPRVAVIIGAVGVALGMDCLEVYGGKVLDLFRAGPGDVPRYQAMEGFQGRTLAEMQHRKALPQGRHRDPAAQRVIFRAGTPTSRWGLVPVGILELVCIASLIAMLSMNKSVGRWVYSGMQVLVWFKWGIGSFLLGDNATEDEDGSPYLRKRINRNRGRWVYCSAFLLNAMLAGVKGKWAYNQTDE